MYRNITFTINASLCSVRNVFLRYYVFLFILFLADDNTAILVKHNILRVAFTKSSYFIMLERAVIITELILFHCNYIRKFSSGKCVFPIHAAYNTTLTH